MTEPKQLVVAEAFTNVHEAYLAKSVLDAAGISALLADEHLVSMNWGYSVAVGGVKVLVPRDQLEEARALLDTEATVSKEIAETGAAGSAADPICRRCGGKEFKSRLPGTGFAMMTWMAFGFPVGRPLRRRYCQQCGEPAPE